MEEEEEKGGVSSRDWYAETEGKEWRITELGHFMRLSTGQVSF